MTTVCLQCGRCCKHLIVEAYWHDAVREPLLLRPDVNVDKLTLEKLEADESRCIVLAACRPCKFLGKDNRCTIYPTRPNVCVGFKPGGEQCERLRANKEQPC